MGLFFKFNSLRNITWQFLTCPSGQVAENQLVRQKINLFSDEWTSVKVFTAVENCFCTSINFSWSPDLQPLNHICKLWLSLFLISVTKKSNNVKLPLRFSFTSIPNPYVLTYILKSTLLGVNVIGCGRNEFRLKAYAKTCPGPGQFIAIRCDIAQESEINHMIQVIKQNYGTVDILINNAGKDK